jgi:hypothetical protein
MSEKTKLIIQFFSAILLGTAGSWLTILAYDRIKLLPYFLIGVVVSIYMVWFYMVKLKRPLHTRHPFLAIIGPFIWPLQISKHIYDLIFNIPKEKNL